MSPANTKLLMCIPKYKKSYNDSRYVTLQYFTKKGPVVNSIKRFRSIKVTNIHWATLKSVKFNDLLKSENT